MSKFIKPHFLHRIKFSKNSRKAFSVLIAGFVLTSIAVFYVRQEAETKASEEFRVLCNEVKVKTATRLRACALLLRSGSALFAASDTVSREKWKSFYERSYYQKNLPGIQGLGYSMIIPGHQLVQHTRRIQKEGFPNYFIKPAGKRDVYTSIIYLEPLSGENLRAFGYDMFSEPIRRRAMEQARDSDLTMLSGKVVLVQESQENPQAGILLYVPVYRKDRPISTVEERRAAIQGWVYSPFRMSSLFSGILGPLDLQKENGIDLQIYDDSLSKASLLYNSHKDNTRIRNILPVRTQALPIEFNKKKWIMLFTQTSLVIPFFHGEVMLVAISGILISILLALLSISLLNTNSRAQRIALQLTFELKERENRFLEVLENSQDASYKRNLQTGKYDYMSPAFTRISGYSSAEMIEMSFDSFLNLINPDDLSIVDQVITESGSYSANTEYTVDYRFKHKEGHYLWFHDKFTVIYDPEQKPLARIGSISNITRTKQSEASLIQSEEKYRSIFENMQDVYFESDLEGCILEISPSIMYLLDYNRAEILGTPLKNLYAGSDSAEDIVKMIADAGEIRDAEILLRAKSSILKYTSLSARFISDSNHKPLKIVGIFRDISERRSADQALRKSEEWHRSILNTAMDGFWISDINGRILEANETYCLMSGYSENELLTMGITDLEANEAESETTSHIEMIMDHGEDQFETRHRRKNGTFFDVEVSAQFLKKDNGRFVVFVHDITKRKEAEKQLLLLSKATEQSPVSVVITNKLGNIEYVNPKFTDVTGYSFEEVRGKKPSILKSDLHDTEFYRDLWNTILSGKTWHGEFCNLKRNGEKYWESAAISPIEDNHGQITFFVAVKEDITEKKQMMEDLLLSKTKAEESDNLKSAFLNNISHEIRTPFNSILGFLSMLQYEDLTVDERGEYVDIINKSAYRLMNTINDIVEISQIQSGQIKLAISEISIIRLLDEMVSRFKSEAEIKGLEFILSVELPGHIENIITDSLKLITILTNLVSNAIKFTRVGSVTLSIGLHEENLLFSVKDTGIGISDDKYQIIFSRFIQADHSTTRQFEGSGLGLTIAKSYVDMLQGKIWLESEVGKGSIFYFTIPFSDVHKVNIPDNTPSLKLTENKIDSLKILIAEDDEGSALLMKIAVKPFCKEILFARSGIHAVEIYRKNPDIDLILMDIRMPDLDGYEATRLIRGLNPEVIIFAQTAFALSGDREKAIAAGCNDYLKKPVRKDQITDLIKKYF